MFLDEPDAAPRDARAARARALGAVADLVEYLNSPEGCPWDREQTPADVCHYLHKEVDELIEAVATGDHEHMGEEWGDVAFIVLFFAAAAERAGEFRLPDAVAGLIDKMVRRHPHVFASADVEGAEGVVRRWREIKAAERALRDRAGVLDDVPPQVSALRKAHRIQARAAEVGFDWPDAGGVWDKLAEELAELERARAANDPATVEHELGDLLFTIVNLQRHLGLEPERALNRTTNRFIARFRVVERLAAERGIDLDAASLAQLDALWDEAKAAEAAPPR